MRFSISRSSCPTYDYDNERENPPCEGAFCYERFEYGTEWFIDLDPSELLAFSIEHGDIIVNGRTNTIEIYDVYRE